MLCPGGTYCSRNYRAGILGSQKRLQTTRPHLWLCGSESLQPNTNCTTGSLAALAAGDEQDDLIAIFLLLYDSSTPLSCSHPTGEVWVMLNERQLIRAQRLGLDFPAGAALKGKSRRIFCLDWIIETSGWQGLQEVICSGQDCACLSHCRWKMKKSKTTSKHSYSLLKNDSRSQVSCK